jgi:tRNA A37 threonylcarbamoyladenosine synthetase subunit TsaC/SUA5/YrdC
MSQHFVIHPDNPNMRLIRQAAEMLRDGAVIVYPTDSGYALGCHSTTRSVARIRQRRQLDEQHHMTLVCRDLQGIALCAGGQRQVPLKSNTPGSYAYAEATKEVRAACSTEAAR